MKSPILGAGKVAPMVGIVGASLVLGFALGRVTLSPTRDLAEGTNQKGTTSEAREGGADWKGAGSSEDLSVGAFASAASIGNPRDRDRALQESLSKLTLSDIKKALAWGESLPDGPMKRAALAKILERWGQLDGRGAVPYASQVYAETGSASLLREALQGWATKDPLGAIQQSSAMRLSENLQKDIRNDLLRQWADQNPGNAAEYALANRNPENWGGVVGTVVDQWSKQDPKAAATWAASLDSGRDKRGAIYTAISNWADEDLNGAASYVSSQPAGESRDTMAGTLARRIGQEDPTAGLKWAAMVADPGTQERAVAGALIDLYQKDEVQARQILQTSSISEQVQQAALIRVTNRGPWWR